MAKRVGYFIDRADIVSTALWHAMSDSLKMEAAEFLVGLCSTELG
jgi:hypothetical protein